MAQQVSKEQYEALKVLIQSGHIKAFNQIFSTGIKRTNFARDVGMNYQTLVYRLKSPGSFTFREAFVIANLIGVEKETISNLIIAQSAPSSSRKGKK